MKPNHGFEYRDRIAPRDAGSSALDYLTLRYRHSTRAQWKRRFADAEILIDDLIGAEDAVLRIGQSLSWRRPPWIEAEVPLAFAILHEDRDLVAVLKPPGLPTLPGGGFLEHTLHHQLRQRVPTARVLHRLGRWTSGIVLAAKHQSAYATVATAFHERRIEKRYRTLATGRPRVPTFEIEVPIGTTAHPILGTIHAAAANGKRARSRIDVLAQRENTFLANVWIETGRPHQIRIHLAAAGYPLAGDPIYEIGGRPRHDCRALPGDPGYLLHAAEVRLAHPRSGAWLVIEAPPPERLY